MLAHGQMEVLQSSFRAVPHGQRPRARRHRSLSSVSPPLVIIREQRRTIPTGSSITVYASVAPNSPAASMSFVVDNSMKGSYTSAANLATGLFHEALWTSPSMNEGTHTLVITQTGAAASGVIYLDYFLYDTTSTSVGSYFLDDRDQSITYTPAWRQFSETANDFQHTSSESTSPGDSFSLQFEGVCNFTTVEPLY